MTVSFVTNLDEAQPYVQTLNREVWRGSSVPSVGHEVVFKIGKRFSFSLRVVAVRWKANGAFTEVELHMPPAPHQTIQEWCKWFKRHEAAAYEEGGRDG